MTGNKPSLQFRAFTSVLIATAFLALVVSGVVLFMAPPGRVANWTNWRVLGLTKHGWGELHIGFSALFLAAAGLHLFFNVRPLLNYFKDRLTRRVGFRREWIAALVLAGVVFAGVRLGVPPFSTLLAFNEQLKQSWEDPHGTAPIPHAELLTLQELAEKAAVPFDTALERLAAQRILGATAEIVVADLAAQNDLSAQRLYEIIQGATTQSRGGGGRGRGDSTGEKSGAGKGGEAGHRAGGGGSGGPGRMTLTEFCESRKIDLTEAQTRLAAKGIKLTPGRTLRDIALDNGFERPYEIVDIIEGKTK
jgi:uncharacterized membrane protein YgcG